ncbi:pseudouridine synthase [Nadsonia fulvescens var. elongata DSM 6958]|uniref:tRNA pseudouridine(32) synthase n=1 Tax=Nadsonia fulvescens var. elongata DSM 6958 TaxID=857566 RepID=A0A1E3PEH3_9ASCO|nr:pseudouridine synthase [Nadsonia fulvescens var. elongata DSM 6958]
MSEETVRAVKTSGEQFVKLEAQSEVLDVSKATESYVTIAKSTEDHVSTNSTDLTDSTPTGQKRFFIPPKKEKGGKVRRDAGGFRIKAQHAAAIDGSKDNAYLTTDGNELNIVDNETQGAKYILDYSASLRRVPPYFFTRMTYCKLRWRDRELLDIFVNEFRSKDEAYYRYAINAGQVLVNDLPAKVDTIIRNGDLIKHRSHMHEPAVTSRPIKIVHEDDELVVIDKPSGIAVHPTGRYRFNTVVMVLKYEQDKIVHPCNRLDRLTSGLMFLAKNSKSAERFGAMIRDREVKKEYIARVVGEFPVDEIICEEPLITVSPKVALNRVDPNGKDSKTVFNRISFDGETSIVRCQPLTGRTHQIRVHLQYLGYPIANDPIYSNPYVWGPELGKLGASDNADIEAKLDKIGKTEISSSFIHPTTERGEKLLDDKCEVCLSDLYSDPGPNDLDLWLHAYKYSAADGSWSYATELPDWALESNKVFMELALDEANKCPPTTTAFGVGALLVHNSRILSTGFSRELVGNTHAEQCALEKYYKETGIRDEVPPGSVIFTTMEPCSERLSGNLPCANRIIATKGLKTVFVGVVEPETFIAKNVGRQKLAEAGIQYFHIAGYEESCLKAATKGHEEK